MAWGKGFAWAVTTALIAVLVWFVSGGDPVTGARVRAIGLVSLSPVDFRVRAGFREGLIAQGLREGRDVSFLETPPAETVDRLPEIVAGLLARDVDLILVSSTPATQAVKKATAGSSIPVVFAPVNDPLGSGIVDDLVQPGGNITGIRLPLGDDLRLHWLTRLDPRVTRVFMPYSPNDKSSLQSLELARSAAGKLGLRLIERPVHGPEEARAAAAEVPAEADAIHLPRDSTIEAQTDAFVATALERRIVLSATSYLQVESGALMCYGFFHEEIGRQAARLAHQILAGTPPGAIPVEVAESHLAINLRSARAIGLEIPADLLRQAHLVLR